MLTSKIDQIDVLRAHGLMQGGVIKTKCALILEVLTWLAFQLIFLVLHVVWQGRIKLDIIAEDITHKLCDYIINLAIHSRNAFILAFGLLSALVVARSPLRCC